MLEIRLVWKTIDSHMEQDCLIMSITLESTFILAYSPNNKA